MRRNKKPTWMNNRQNGGFFLVELIVAIFIFGIVMTMSTSALVLALDANKKTQTLKSVLNNLDVVLDTMTRTLAVGSLYYCGGDPIPHTQSHDCPLLSAGSGDGADHSGVSFKFNEDLGADGLPNDVITYQFVKTGSAPGYIQRIIHSDAGTSGPVRMTAPEVNITDARFYVTGSTSVGGGDFRQPKVLIVINGEAPSGPRNLPTKFTVQTVVTDRTTDNSITP